MSKQTLMTVIDKKVMASDTETRNLEKQYDKGGIDTKRFIEEFMEKRKDFHKYSILKVKVSMS